MNIKELLRRRKGWVRRENRVGKVDGISSKHIYIYENLIMKLIILYKINAG